MYGSLRDETTISPVHRDAAAFAVRRLKADRAAMARKDAERDKMLGLFRRGRITEAVLDAQLDAIEGERAALAGEIVAAADAAERARQEKEGLVGAGGLLAELGRRLDDGLDFPTRRKIVEALVNGITVTGQGAEQTATVTYRFDLPAAAITNAAVAHYS